MEATVIGGDDDFATLPVSVRTGRPAWNNNRKRDKAADCTLLPIDGQKFVLLDAGFKKTSQNIKDASKFYKRAISGVIITHFDEDHYNGFDKLLSEMLLSSMAYQSETVLEGIDANIKSDVLQHNFELIDIKDVISVFTEVISTVTSVDLDSAEMKIRHQLAEIERAYPYSSDLKEQLEEWKIFFLQNTYGWVRGKITKILNFASFEAEKLVRFQNQALECFLSDTKSPNYVLKIAEDMEKVVEKIFSHLESIEDILEDIDSDYADDLLDHFESELDDLIEDDIPYEWTIERLFKLKVLRRLIELLRKQAREIGRFQLCPRFFNTRDSKCPCELCSELSDYEDRNQYFAGAILSTFIAALPASNFLAATKLVHLNLGVSKRRAIDELSQSIRWIAFPPSPADQYRVEKLLIKIEIFMKDFGPDDDMAVLYGDEASMYVYKTTKEKVLPFHYAGPVLRNGTENRIIVHHKRESIHLTIRNCTTIADDVSSVFSFGSDFEDNDSSLLTIYHADKDKTKNYLFTGDCSLHLIAQQIHPSMINEDTRNFRHGPDMKNRIQIYQAIQASMKSKFHVFQLPHHGSRDSLQINGDFGDASLNYLVSMGDHFYVSGAEKENDMWPHKEVKEKLSWKLRGQGKVLSAYKYPGNTFLVGLMHDYDKFKEIDANKSGSAVQAIGMQRPRPQSWVYN